jgi:sulfur-oxidizing protein SoxZ
MSRALVNVPPKARPGEVITIKALIQHKMETGFRYSNLGERIPRDIITTFIATYDGTEIFRCELSPAVAANPFIAFTTVAKASGTIALWWTGDNGFSVTEEARITVG